MEPEIITIEQARLAGLKKYYTGEPCKRGHYAYRYIVTRGCCECVRQTTEMVCWRNMIARCNNPNHPSYSWYGERGIRVCEGWLKSFDAFCLDMGPRPAGTTLNRHDNDGDYCPQNCHWATYHVQHRNKSTNRFIELDGRRICFKDAARTIGTSMGRISYWTRKLGSHQLAVEHVKRVLSQRPKPMEPATRYSLILNGEQMSLNQIAKRVGRSISTIVKYARIHFRGDVQAAIDSRYAKLAY